MNNYVLILLLFLLTACTQPIKFIMKEQNTLEFSHEPFELIQETDAEEIFYSFKDSEGNDVLEKNIKINLPYTLCFTVVKNGKEKLFEKQITFIDTTPPKIEAKSTVINLEFGSETFELEEWIKTNITATDNYSSLSISLPEINSTLEEEKTIIFTDEAGNQSSIVIKIKLMDTTPPIITPKQVEFSVIAGDKAPTFENYATALDLKEGELSITIENDWNSNLPGEYNLLFVATDSAGNRAEFPFLYIVKARTEKIQSTPIPSIRNPSTENNSSSNWEQDKSNSSESNEINPGAYPTLDACKEAAESACSTGYICGGSDHNGGWIYDCN